MADEKKSKPSPAKIGFIPLKPVHERRTGYRDRAMTEPEIDPFGADDYSEESYA